MEQTSLDQQQFVNPNYDKLPNFFRQAQAQAFAQWDSLELPTIERMRYKKWPLFSSTIASKATSETSNLSKALETVAGDLLDNNEVAARIIHYGNNSILDYMDPDLADKGVIVQDLFTALVDYPDLIQNHLFSTLPPTADKVNAYHTAYMNGGLFIYIPKDIEIKLPIETVLIQNSSVDLAFNKHLLIVSESNSRVTYLERSATVGDQTNSATILTEVIALSGAQVKFVAMDALGESTCAFVRRHGITYNDANIEWAVAAMNQGDTILDTYTELKGQGSESNTNIISIANGKQTQMVNTKLLNAGHNSVANIFQHGVILDQARLSFNGIGHIVKDAKEADAQQESRLMMLSQESRGDTNPILYIDEFEVTAGHAASVGQVDPEQLYYLMSRGLSQSDAEYLLIRGFLGQVIQTIPSTQVRQQMVNMIDNKLQLFHPANL
ncbi:Fe-S cluster assembly protein SufD [Aerococcaceae bacterium WGS1372]